MPSPCSPDSEPPLATSRSAPRSARRRKRARSSGVGQVEQRPHVHAADRGVAVDDRHGALVAERLAQARQVGAEALDRHGAVLDDGGRPPAAAHGAVDGALQVAAEADDARVRLGAVDRDDAGEAGDLRRAHQVARGLHLVGGAGVLDQQHGVGAGRDVARRGAADDGAGVDDLDGGGRRRQHGEGGVADRVERVEADDRPGAQRRAPGRARPRSRARAPACPRSRTGTARGAAGRPPGPAGCSRRRSAGCAASAPRSRPASPSWTARAAANGPSSEATSVSPTQVSVPSASSTCRRLMRCDVRP